MANAKQEAKYALCSLISDFLQTQKPPTTNTQATRAWEELIEEFTRRSKHTTRFEEPHYVIYEDRMVDVLGGQHLLTPTLVTEAVRCTDNIYDLENIQGAPYGLVPKSLCPLCGRGSEHPANTSDQRMGDSNTC